MNAVETQVGDIFVCRWGHIDKIVDFYKVVQRTSRTVTLKKLKNRVVKKVHRDGPAGSNLVVPSNEFDDENVVLKKKVQDDGSLKIKSYASAYKWDGKPVERIFGYY